MVGYLKQTPRGTRNNAKRVNVIGEDGVKETVMQTGEKKN